RSQALAFLDRLLDRLGGLLVLVLDRLQATGAGQVRVQRLDLAFQGLELLDLGGVHRPALIDGLLVDFLHALGLLLARGCQVGDVLAVALASHCSASFRMGCVASRRCGWPSLDGQRAALILRSTGGRLLQCARLVPRAGENGAGRGNRTPNLRLTMTALYQLS